MNQNTTENLKKIVEKGEGQALEFKINAENIGKDICAFANTNDGIILVGVEDKGNIIGIKDKKIEEEIANIAHSCDPPVRVVINKIENVLIIKVKKSNKIHSFKGIVYIRVGSTNKPLSMHEVLDLGHKLGKIQFDNQICEEATLEGIDWDFVENVFIKNYETINKTKINSAPKSLLESLDCIKNNKPTNACILLFGKEPQRFFINAYIAIAKYKEDTITGERLDYKEFNENIFNQIDESVKYILNNISIMSRLIPGVVKREDIPEYPLFSIREVITNAVTHRDYTQQSKIIIKIFPKRIEIYNPGGLLAGITSKNIADKQYSRNPIIAKVLSKVRYIEELGEGWDKIIEEHKIHPLKPKIPSIRDINGSVIVDMFSVKEKFEEKGKVEIILNERQKKAIEFLKENKIIALSDYKDLCEEISDKTLFRDLQDLVKKDVLKQFGKKRGRYYELK